MNLKLCGIVYHFERYEFVDRKFDCEVLATMDRHAHVSDQKETVYEKAMKVRVVDSIGAGDAFMAAYVASRIKGILSAGEFKKSSWCWCSNMYQKRGYRSYSDLE